MHPPSAAELAEEFDVLADPTLGTDRERLLRSVSDTVALVVRNQTQVDHELLDRAPGLRVIARLGVGLDNIDLDACGAQGIEVAPARGANATAVAEYVIGSLLTLLRGVFDATDRVISGEWPRSELRGGELAGKTLGLFGYGIIARQVAERALAMGMTVISHDPFIDSDDPVWGPVIPVEVDELIAGSDALSVHVPLTPGTRHLVDEERISTMRPGALLVNTARGGVVDEGAVARALISGRLGGAALDVFEHEPLDAVQARTLQNVPNLILTPHIAGITRESEARIGEMAAAAVRRHLVARP